MTTTPADGDARYLVKLDIFEGPLDLLLHLIRRHEIDIFDIPVAFITARYLEYLDLMKQINLDLAAEYLEMAAYLTLLKSRELLPNEPSGDDEEFEEGPDPREELVRRLLEYQKYKTAADELLARPQLGRDTFPRGAAETVHVDRQLANPGLYALFEAFRALLDDADEDPMQEISITRMTVTQRIHQLVDTVRERVRLAFTALFEGQSTRSDFVVTFLALLEMTKLGLTLLHQADSHGELYIKASAGMEHAERLLEERALED